MKYTITLLLTIGYLLTSAQLFQNLSFEEGTGTSASQWEVSGNGKVTRLKTDTLFGSVVSPADGEYFMKLELSDTQTFERLSLYQRGKFTNQMLEGSSQNLFFYTQDVSRRLSASIFYNGYNWNSETNSRQYLFRMQSTKPSYNFNFPIPDSIYLNKFSSGFGKFHSNEKPDSMELEIRLAEISNTSKVQILYIDNLQFETYLASVPEVTKAKQFVFGPNPVNNELVIHNKTRALFKLSITNMLGQIEEELEQDQSKSVLDVSHLTSGLYYLTILNLNDGVSETHPFIKR